MNQALRKAAQGQNEKQNGWEFQEYKKPCKKPGVKK
jgi:hypothetical protein